MDASPTAFVVPAVALAGAALVALSLARQVRRYRRERTLRVLPLAIALVAAVFLIVLPLGKVLVVLGLTGGGPPRVVSRFGDWLGGEGYPRRDGRHTGVDIAGRVGTAVLAPADGRVAVARDNRDSCGLIVVIEHAPHGYRTVHCHLSVIAVYTGQAVVRGQRVGAIGASGLRAWPGYEHVHWELRRSRDGAREDPLARTVGCFDTRKTYPTDRLALTYPVKC